MDHKFGFVIDAQYWHAWLINMNIWIFALGKTMSHIVVSMRVHGRMVAQ